MKSPYTKKQIPNKSQYPKFKFLILDTNNSFGFWNLKFEVWDLSFNPFDVENIKKNIRV